MDKNTQKTKQVKDNSKSQNGKPKTPTSSRASSPLRSKQSAQHEHPLPKDSAAVVREGLYLDPRKAAIYHEQARVATLKRIQKQRTSALHTNIIGSKKSPSVVLMRKRKRGVVKQDWGISNREERLHKRVQVMESRLAKRRRAVRYRRQEKMEPEVQEPTTVHTAADEQQEQWYQPVLDVAKELAPTILPLIAGMGDYTVDDIANQEMPRTNSLAACFTEGEMCGDVPMMHSDGMGTRVVHREYLGDVYSATTAFLAQQFAINPGLSESFPWVSSMAPLYEAYQVHGMMACFESEGSEYANSVGLGYVGLASQYDVTAPAFASKKDMLQSLYCVARKPSESFPHWIECAPPVEVQSEMLTRTGAIPAGSDLHFYDHCNLTLGVGGMTASGVVIGELWLTYDIEFFYPQSDLAYNSGSEYFRATSTSGVDSANPLGSAWTLASRNNIKCTLTPTSIQFPAGMTSGTYMVIYSYLGSAAPGTGSFPAITSTTVDILPIVSSSGTGGPSITASMTVIFAIVLKGNPGSRLDIAVTGLVGPTAAQVDIILMALPAVSSTSSSAIFDFQGKEYDARYEKMMDLVLHRTPDVVQELLVEGSCVLLSRQREGVTQYTVRDSTSEKVIPDVVALYFQEQPMTFKKTIAYLMTMDVAEWPSFLKLQLRKDL